MHTAHLLTPPAPAECVADADITTAIEILLATKKGLSTHGMYGITVHTRGGMVELAGFTDNLLSQQRAEEITLAVHSALARRTAGVPNAEWQHAVARALADDPATNDYQVHCLVNQGLVTLSGTVQTWTEKQLVLRVPRGVRRVRDFVADHLIIRGGEIMNSDEEIATQIRELLDWNIRANGSLVQAHTEDQVVHLAGTVGTAAGRDCVVVIILPDRRHPRRCPRLVRGFLGPGPKNSPRASRSGCLRGRGPQRGQRLAGVHGGWLRDYKGGAGLPAQP